MRIYLGIYNNLMKNLLIFLLFFITTFANSFDYIREAHGKRNIIKSFSFSEDEKFINFTLDGTFTDNLGNYGYFENAVSVVLKNNDVVNLEARGRWVYQNREELYTKGFRNQQEKDSGVGQQEIIGTSQMFKKLIGIKCNYSVNFFDDFVYALNKCNITDKQKNILESLSN